MFLVSSPKSQSCLQHNSNIRHRHRCSCTNPSYIKNIEFDFLSFENTWTKPWNISTLIKLRVIKISHVTFDPFTVLFSIILYSCFRVTYRASEIEFESNQNLWNSIAHRFLRKLLWYRWKNERLLHPRKTSLPTSYSSAQGTGLRRGRKRIPLTVGVLGLSYTDENKDVNENLQGQRRRGIQRCR